MSHDFRFNLHLTPKEAGYVLRMFLHMHANIKNMSVKGYRLLVRLLSGRVLLEQRLHV
jgi:hypothetical protein